MRLTGLFDNGFLTRGDIRIAPGSTGADGKPCPYSLYSGTFNADGELHGEGCSVVSADNNMQFTGRYDKGVCVTGIQEFQTGEIVSREGTFVDGLLDGQNCTERLRSGEVRTGTFAKGLLIEGSITDPRGAIVLRRGTFKDNELNGKNCFAQCSDGGTYSGNFDEGVHVRGERRGGACLTLGANLEIGQFTNPALGRSFVFGNDCKIEFTNGNVWEVEINGEGKITRGKMSYTQQTNDDISSKTGVFYTNTNGMLREGVLKYHNGTLVIGGFDAHGNRNGQVFLIEGNEVKQATYENGDLKAVAALPPGAELPKQYHQYLPISTSTSGGAAMIPSHLLFTNPSPQDE